MITALSGTFLSSLHVLSHSDHYTHFPGKGPEVQKGEVVCKDHMGGKRERQDLNSEPILLTFHGTAVWMGKAVFSHEHCP